MTIFRSGSSGIGGCRIVSSISVTDIYPSLQLSWLYIVSALDIFELLSNMSLIGSLIETNAEVSPRNSSLDNKRGIYPVQRCHVSIYFLTSTVPLPKHNCMDC